MAIPMDLIKLLVKDAILISQFCWTETNKPPLKGKEYIYKIYLSGLSSIPDFSGRQIKVIFEII